MRVLDEWMKGARCAVNRSVIGWIVTIVWLNTKLELCVLCRKADLRELKRLHVQENRLMQALASRAVAAKEEQMKKFEIDKQVAMHVYCTLSVHCWITGRASSCRKSCSISRDWPDEQ